MIFVHLIQSRYKGTKGIFTKCLILFAYQQCDVPKFSVSFTCREIKNNGFNETGLDKK